MNATVWITVIGLVVGTAAIKALGPMVFGGRDLPGALVRVIPRLPPALLAALVLTDTFTGVHRSLVLDARAGGLATAALALALRLPLIAVVVLAAATTGLLRALG
ncbi:MAG TPA: AzlD domain-containing protein [Solirubrobacteraceae bacterium]|nr:AzlD domain-containing protein [Solirubrobacteraceae bacterium]